MNAKSMFRCIALLLAVALAAVLLAWATARPALGLEPGEDSPYQTAAEWTLEGRVYEGQLGEEPATALPLSGVTVELFGSNGSYPNTGRSIRSTTTDSQGWYGLQVLSSDGYEFYYIHEIDPSGYLSVGALSLGGIVRNSNWIEYGPWTPGDKTLTGNKFWDKLPVTASPSPTASRTHTPTPTAPPVATGTPTPTGTQAASTATPTATPRQTETPTSSPSATATLPAGCTELMVNGGFEAGGLVPWGASGAAGLGPGHSSPTGAWLGGADNAHGELWQPVTIPAGAQPVRLSFWWLAESAADQPGDTVAVLLQYPGGTTQLRTLRAVAPLWQWRQEIVDVTANAGQAVVPTFLAITDAAVPSSFRLDDVSVLACGISPSTATPSSTPGPTLTGTPTATGVLPAYRWRFIGLTTVLADPLPSRDVEVALYGAAMSGQLGERLAGARSGQNGAYELDYGQVLGAGAAKDYPYFHIVVSDPRYQVEQAASQSGRVTDQHWIEFASPQPGLYEYNDFILKPLPGTPTSTVTPSPVATTASTPSPTPTTGGGSISRTFSGTVYRVELDHPVIWPGVSVSLYASGSNCDEGSLVARMLTDAQGEFHLDYSTPAQMDADIYNLIADDDRIHVTGGESGSGARMTSQGWLQFSHPPAGGLVGNDLVGELIAGVRVDADAVADAYVSQQQPDLNYGNWSVLSTGYSSGPDTLRNRAYVRFNLSYIPSSAKVTKATLNLYHEWSAGLKKVCISVYGVGEDWTEGPHSTSSRPITWGNQPTELTFETDHSVDRNAGYKSWDVTSLVQEWVSDAGVNHGVALAGPEQDNGWTRLFSSREGSYVPRLVLYVQSSTAFATPTLTPTPSATPTSTPVGTAVSRSVQIAGIEINQAIQDTDTTAVPLVAGKSAMVRVHLKVTDGKGDIAGVKGTMTFPNYANVHLPVNSGGSMTARANPDRGKISQTLNFVISTTEATGSSNYLFLRVIPPDGVSFSSIGELQETRLVSFQSRAAINLRIVPVSASNITPTVTSNGDVNAALNYLRAVFPVSKVNVTTGSAVTANYDYSNSSGGCGKGWDALLNDLATVYTNWSSQPANAFLYGVLDSSVPHSYSGCGRRPGSVAAGILGSSDTLAHELGHNYGRKHAPSDTDAQGDLTNPDCSTTKPANPDSSYPQYTSPGGTSYPRASIGEYGLTQAFSSCSTGGCANVYDPAQYYDVMSYCFDKWISPYTYKGLFNAIPATSAQAATGPAAETPHLAAQGGVQSGQIELPRPFWVQPFPEGSHAEPGAGPYSLELQNGAGSVLFLRRFDPRDPYDGTDPDSGTFNEILPFAPGTARIVFRRQGEVVRTVEISPHAPTVTLLKPNGGENWDGAGPYTVAWHAEDLDGGPLTTNVLYSADNGATWQPLAVNVQGDHLQVDAGNLPGAEQARVRVRVSDGVNTTSADCAAPFRVARKAPSVWLLSPTASATVRPGMPTTLEGLASDPEDGPLPEEALAWYSDRDGPLGTGTSLIITLSPGMHRITLRGTDGDGLMGSANVSIFSGLKSYLPVILR